MNNFTSRFFTAAALSLFAVTAIAQQAPKPFGKTISRVNPSTGQIRCVSTEYGSYLKEQHPERETEAQFEEWMAEKLAEAKTRRNANSTNTVVTIPVVVHVIHNESSVGVNENIADEQVLSQITVLNQDYRRMIDTPGWNTSPVGADMEINFALAQVDPNGNPTNGIHRVYYNRASWGESNVETIMKPQTQWDPTRYFNIWVCKFGGDLDGVLGYAQFPSSSTLNGLASNGGSSNTDGVVIGYQYFGSQDLYPDGNFDATYNMGRTATHEIGHCLGLRHVDGDNTSCTVNSADTYKDYCPDTPAIKELNYECSYIDSCPNASGVDMIENYMDYTPDYCMNIFTKNQKSRMAVVLQNSPNRASLTTSNVWQAMGTTDFAFANINIYPNPAQDVLNIAMPAGQTADSISIHNSLGQVVATIKPEAVSQIAVNTSGFSNGIYFVKIARGAETRTIKFVKN